MSSKKMYEIHKVDENTGKHLPILVGFTGDMRPAQSDEDSMRKALRLAKDSGARPIEEFPDGRVQMGHYMYVPIQDGDDK